MSPLIAFGIFGLLLLIVLVFVAQGGRAFLLGGAIVKTWDGVAGVAKVHAVEASPSGRLVGLEVSPETFEDNRLVQISFPAATALELAQLIAQAAQYSPADDKRSE